MNGIFQTVRYEYTQGNLKHLLVGAIESGFVKLLQIHRSIYWNVAPAYFRWRCSDDIFEYDCPPDPFKIEWINPSQITYKTGRANAFRNRRLQFGSVRSGDWDRDRERFEETPLYQATKRHFEDNIPWEETEEIQQRIEAIEAGEWIRYSSGDELLDRYYRFDELYHKIKNEGYRSQSELLAETNGYSDGLYLDTLNEVTVDVGRDGELLYVDGFHRLAAAKLLNIEQIPVVFLTRHTEWMEYRQECCENINKITDNPDLNDIASVN